MPRSKRSKRPDLTFDDVDMLIPHQANMRIIDAAARRLALPREKVWVNLDRYGNTSAASIPIALFEAAEAGKLDGGRQRRPRRLRRRAGLGGRHGALGNGRRLPRSRVSRVAPRLSLNRARPRGQASGSESRATQTLAGG